MAKKKHETKINNEISQNETEEDVKVAEESQVIEKPEVAEEAKVVKKAKVNHFVFVTTGEEDEEINRYQVKPWLLWLIIALLCIILGATLGYISYEESIWQAVDARSDEQVAAIKTLEEKNALLEQKNLSLETEIVGLKETVQILSETVSQKTQIESELKAQIEKQSIPSEFPLNGSASMKETTEDDAPICVFDASIGSAVVATASGTVLAVKDDAKYVHSIWVDHGNGYITIYRNAAEPRVQIGDEVVSGTALYIIEERKEDMGYQMMKDDVYISPMEMMSING